MEKPQLNRPNMDYRGPEWAALRGWLEEELARTMGKMLTTSLTESETQQLRGRALVIKQMLDFPEAGAAFGPHINQ